MKGREIHDVLNIGSLTFNKASGAQKNLAAGPHLKPLVLDPAAPTFTTDASTARSVRPGALLAIYNNSGTAGAITLGTDAAVPALAIGVADSSGRVGIACKPNDWTYVSVYDKSFIRTTAATLLVYIVEDDTYISNESISK